MARLFFALWPEPDAARALERLSHDLAAVARGRAVAPEKIHLTLAFLGEVDEARLARARAVRPAAAPFGITLDCVGSFRAARVAWAGSLAPNEALAGLQAALAARLREQGFALEERAFAPHVTLVRRTARPVPRARIEPIGWTARSLALVRSRSGAYETIDAWPLGGGSGAAVPGSE